MAETHRKIRVPLVLAAFSDQTCACPHVPNRMNHGMSHPARVPKHKNKALIEHMTRNLPIVMLCNSRRPFPTSHAHVLCKPTRLHLAELTGPPAKSRGPPQVVATTGLLAAQACRLIASHLAPKLRLHVGTLGGCVPRRAPPLSHVAFFKIRPPAPRCQMARSCWAQRRRRRT